MSGTRRAPRITHASVNGRVVPLARAVVPVTDGAVTHGDGVFETIRLYGGTPRFLTAHRARLVRGARLLGLACPSRAALTHDINALLRRNLGCGDAVCRVSLSRPPGADPAARGAARATRVITLRALPADLSRARSRGISARTVPFDRGGGPAATVKSLSYLPSLLALRLARAAGAREAILVSPSGEILEGAASNVFVRIGNRFVTPPADGRILPGVVRGLLLDLARARSLPVAEAPVRLRDLSRAREIFVTNAVREIVPVVRLDGRAVGDGKPGRQTRRIQDAWEAYKTGLLESAR